VINGYSKTFTEVVCLQPVKPCESTKPVSNSDTARQLNVVVDLNRNDELETADDWLRRHHVVSPKEKKTSPTKVEQKLKPKPE